MLQVGDLAPNFKLLDSEFNEIELKSFLGQPVILYFYPKDDTPGCTKEAIGFSEALAEIESHNAVVIGVSKDSPEKHKKFIEKHDLKVLLLSDPDNGTIDAYGAWREKKNYGRTYMGIVRSTYLIDSEGRIAQIWDNVKVTGHVEKVCSVLATAPSAS